MTDVNERTDTWVAAADYVVVGTGSAGSVVAERLSADPRNQVVVMEAGANNTNKRCPVLAAGAQLFRGPYDWDYWTEPQPGLTGRRIYWPQGKTQGGSPPLDAMMWLRGFAADYDEWAELAGPEWAFSQVVKHLKRIENVAGARDAHDGVDDPPYIYGQTPRSATATWLMAARQAGYPLERPNMAGPNGFSRAVVTQRHDARWGLADAYLRAALGRKNLTLLTEATATRVIFEGVRAVGIEFEKDGGRGVVRARREVVLCAGTLNSPQLLMLSGIGDQQQLRRHGIDTVHHSPEVGQNLRDHLVAVLGFDARTHTLSSPPAELVGLVNYLIRRRGMLTTSAGEASGFVRSRPELALPDLELVFEPAPFLDAGLGDRYGHAVLFGPILLKPHSSGRIWLRSADPTAKPIIDPGYLSDRGGLDRAAMMEGLRMCAKIAQAPALTSLLGSIPRPLGAPDPREETLAEALNSHSQSIYHPVGTCRMGHDPASVVTPQLEVRGAHGLRVADASVMPTAIRGQTYAPSVLIGARAADLIAAAIPD
jgi:choline dehydrogenase